MCPTRKLILIQQQSQTGISVGIQQVTSILNSLNSFPKHYSILHCFADQRPIQKISENSESKHWFSSKVQHEIQQINFLNSSCIQKVNMRQSCKLEKNKYCNGYRFNNCAKYIKHFCKILQIFANAKTFKKYVKHFILNSPI